MDMDWKSRGRPPKSQLILVSHDFPFRRWHLFWVKSTIFRSDWRITPASTTRGLLFGFVRTLALSPPFFGWVRVFYPEYPVFFCCPIFVVVTEGKSLTRCWWSTSWIMVLGPQCSSIAARRISCYCEAPWPWHVGDVERAGRKKWWGWVKNTWDSTLFHTLETWTSIYQLFPWGWYFRDDIRSFDDKNLRIILADIGRVGCNLPQRWDML